jgi:uncharacterized membrane protein
MPVLRLRIIFLFLLYLLYAWFCAQLVLIAWQYVPFNTDVAFLRIKTEVAGYTWYRLAFFTHVYSTLLVLPAGFVQFSPGLRRQCPAWHRRVGWLYMLAVLGPAGVSGFVMGLVANGGFSSQLAFTLLALLWWLFTWKALQTARNKNFSAHRVWMIRSFALALSAITLRAWKPLLVWLFHPHPMDVYRLVAWMGWVLNLLVAEWIILRITKRSAYATP